ncbi:MAG: SBBP repeat-containing protein [Phycisphaerales bacterium]
MTNGSLGGPELGGFDVFLKKIDPSGAELWSRQIGTSSRDGPGDVAIDSRGNIFVTGWTAGHLAAQNAGEVDLFLMKLDPSGNEVWSYQIGTDERDVGSSLAIDSQDNIYLSGTTLSDFAGEHQGDYDIFLIKFTVPEPTSMILFASGGLLIGFRRHDASRQ